MPLPAQDPSPPPAAGPSDPAPGPRRLPVASSRDEIVAKLDNLKVTLEFNETPLEDVIEFVRDIADLNIVIDGSVRERHGSEPIKVSLKVTGLPLRSALKLILETRGLTMVYRHDVLVVVTQDEANKTLVMEVYDVRDLMMQVRDFPGPVVTLVRDSVEMTPPEEPPAPMTDDYVLTMVREHCGKGTWDANPACSVDLHNGLLTVRQTTEVHQQVRNLLSMLRANK